MYQRDLNTLEYNKILGLLKEKCGCCVSRELADKLCPETDIYVVENELAITGEAETVFRRTGNTPVDDFPDMRECLKRIKGTIMLTARELIGISECLRAARRARDMLANNQECFRLNNLGAFIQTHRSIEEEIDRCIINEDEIFDGASSELSRIRRGMRIANEKVRERLNSIIHSSTYQKYLQEPIITIRNGRFVIPVKQEYRQNVPGLVHDQSGSGATVFIEPAAVVEMGNEYKRLLSEESEEIERILMELTAMVAPYGEAILNSLEIMGEIDLAFAKARLGVEMRGIIPKLNDSGHIRIIKGRHPLISKDTVVPIDLWLGKEFRSLIITGPNTGGKTVTLKIVGLFEAMVQSGMLIPADEGTELSVFDNIFADVGDEQSIEQSLSTFSSHMRNVVDILSETDEHTLVLLDELGAGTDPIEGAALAMSILETIHDKGAVCVSTTHYSEIKAFAMTHKGMENASMQFDVDRLCPTYKLFIGIPGKSNAFEISRRLGLSAEIIDKAKDYLDGEDVRFEDIISSAQDQHMMAEEERKLAQELHSEAERLREEIAADKKKLEDERACLRAKAKEEARRIIQETKREMDGIIVTLRSMKELDRSAVDRAIQTGRDTVRKREQAIAEKDAIIPNSDGVKPKTLKPGDTVRIVNLDQKATVLSVPDAKGDVLVQAGIIKLTVKLDELRIENEPPKQKAKPKAGLAVGMHMGFEIDIRGMVVEEGTATVDRFIDSAYNAGLTEINIIHGKGTGALRVGIQTYLKHHPMVKSFRMGNYGEGDAGVTVVTLKS